MTPEEERQNALLLGQDLSAEPESMPSTGLPEYYSSKAEQARSGLAAPSHVQEQALHPAAQVKSGPVTDSGPHYQDESTGSKLLQALGALGGVVKTYGAYKSARDMRDKPGGYVGGAQPAFTHLAEEGAQDVTRANQAQAQHEHESHAAQRQAYLDKQASEDRSRRMAREDVEDTFTNEARDPGSEKSKNLRAEIQTAFPQFAESMGPDFEHMSVYDFAHTPHPGLDKAKFDAQTERQRELLQGRGTQAHDLETQRQTGRVELEHERTAGRVQVKQTSKAGHGTSGHGAPVDTSELMAALDKEFGGRDKIPPTLIAQVQEAAAITDQTKRHTAIAGVMQRAHVQNTAGQRQTDTESAAYAKAAEPAEQTLAWARNVRKELQANGINPDKYRGEDIPGYGRLASYMPDQVLSAKGQRMRATIEGEVAGLILAMSGKASNEREAARLKKAAGAIKGGAPENVIWGLHQLEAIAKDQIARAKASHARGADAAGAGGVRVRDPKTGQTGMYAGTAEEAKAAGYEVQ